MKLQLKRIILKYDVLFNFYYRYIYKPKNELAALLNNLSKNKNGNIFFIQIGANDGNWGDPIHKFVRRDNWTGILIEPQKIVFERLLNNYKNRNNLFFENVAIDLTEGERILYKISFSDSQWALGISSFIKNDIQKLIDAGYIERMTKAEGKSLPANKEEWIGEEKVNVQTIRNIIEKYQVQIIDLLLIDTEGYDFEIIKTIPFEKIKPTVIVYENSHFDEVTRIECENYLRECNYNIIPMNGNTIAELV